MSFTLTKREEELMEFLWQQGEPLAANEILDRCKERSWSDRYLQAMLRSLEKKGAIEASGTLREGNHYSRRFRCRMTKEEYFAQLAKASGADSRLFTRAVVSLAAEASPAEQEKIIQELERLLEDYKKRG